MYARSLRIFLIVLALSALWVGGWSYFDPAFVVIAMPWPAPPLHARFIGALYLSVTVVGFLAAFAKTNSALRGLPWLYGIWTGMMGIATFINFTEDQYSNRLNWIWIAAYVIYPLLGLGFALLGERKSDADAPDDLRGWRHWGLKLQAIFLIGIGVGLFALPGLAERIWPWPINVVLAQLYAGPIVGFGVVSYMACRSRSVATLPMIGGLVSIALILVASAIHVRLFSVTQVSTLVWFGGLVAMAVVMSGVLAHRPKAAKFPQEGNAHD